MRFLRASGFPIAPVISLCAMTVLMPVASFAQAPPAPAAPPTASDPKAAFERGNSLLEAKRYSEALAEYQKVLAVDPKSEAALWNGGMAAFFAKELPTATDLFQRLKHLDPQNGMVLAKLVQTYEAAGKTQERDAARNELIALHRSGKDISPIAKRDMFCRDQYRVGENTVFAYEKFEFKPKHQKGDIYFFAPRYDFLVAKPDGNAAFHIEVGWDFPTKDARGNFVPGGGFYFDAYYPEGLWQRKTFGVFEKEMSYVDSKAWVGKILAGKVSMTGGERRTQSSEEESPTAPKGAKKP